MNKIQKLLFDVPLIEGIVQTRKSQFTMWVNVGNEVLTCHCPTTGRVGNIELADRPCLLSKSTDPKRKTPYTVEAVSLNHADDASKKWIGINQNAANRYVEHFLQNGALTEITGGCTDIHREQFLGVSKLDFRVGDTYIEVKTPLQHLQIDIPSYVKMKKTTPFNSTERFVKHITTLKDSLQAHERAILLTCFIYDNPGFQVIEKSTNYETVKKAMDNCIAAGVEQWQVNFEITSTALYLKKYYKLNA